MAKQIIDAEVKIMIKPDGAGSWLVSMSANMNIGLSEYPDYQQMNKGSVIILTPVQQTTILSFVKTVVLPQITL